ncbi:MAG: ATP-binding protein, partial [Pseudomonadota bacterium]|nr:ATP-binding protein [Pseudomonadota bacterium]
LQQLDLRHAIDVAVDACMPAIDTRTQQLILRLPEPPVYICGDALRMAQILGNLLDNASKYTPAGGSITLAMHCEAECAIVQVIDTGMGISAEALDHIFELFAQDSHTEAMGVEGFGIGLAVVRELCQAHGGSVMAQSDGPGCGTTLTVTLPLAPVDGTDVLSVETGAGR